MLQNPSTKFYTMEYPVKKVTVTYWFNHSKMGFNNSITVDAINNQQAIDKAQYEVAGVYGSKMLKRFSFTLNS